MKHFIKLTCVHDPFSPRAVYIAVDSIGSLFRITERKNGREHEFTRVGTTTHNNGGWDIDETPLRILAKIAVLEGK